MTLTLPTWPLVYGQPPGSGQIRQLASDFCVSENLSFEPSGAGEHVFLRIQKTGENTEFVARQLARFANVRQRDVSYAGLKDRHAVATQWFSVWLPGKEEPDWSAFATDSIKILQHVRHARKLKRGVLSGNHFVITIRAWQGDQGAALQRLAAISCHGIANYYGPQRFGHDGQNLNKALAMFQGAKVGREQRSLYLSAARSFLFNQLLARRVLDQSWDQAVPGDTFQFDLSHSCFTAEDIDDSIIQRLAAQQIHVTGVLWGKGGARVLPLEQAVVTDYPALAAGLVACGLEQDRRALRVQVPDLQGQFVDDTTLRLSFTLPAGSYATALLRELIGD